MQVQQFGSSFVVDDFDWEIVVRCKSCDEVNPGSTPPAMARMWRYDGRWKTGIALRLGYPDLMGGRTQFWYGRGEDGPAKDPMPLQCRRCKRIPGKKRRDLWAAATRAAELGVAVLYV
jgi:hypothetical protein